MTRPPASVQKSYQQVLPVSPEKSVRLQEKGVEEDRVEPAAPPAARKMSATSSEPPSAAGTARKGEENIAGESAPQPAAEAEPAPLSVGAAGMAADSVKESREGSAAEWIAQVGNLPGWKALWAEGGRILETEDAAVRLPLLSAIVRAMEVADEPAKVEGQCRRILELIAKEHD
jgi:hypothetical protein